MGGDGAVRPRERKPSMDTWDAFPGLNAGYAEELYERYLHDPESVDPETRAFFDARNGHRQAPVAEPAAATSAAPPVAASLDVHKIVLAARLARAIREYGHLDARIDPLGRPRPG